ncbi:hypothetical protein [Bacteroides bouchesdurhonensis]|uniref:hypothetical protein n=1 Tax=Bacteroides bouchesdurhonensis TaxID=1841855 RepID=UPI00097F6F9E|nr:hypothetical protein [Bacteroides bouchesdurhonensis]
MKKNGYIIASFIIICVVIICSVSKTSYIFIGNSYEGGKDINVTIVLDDTLILHDGILEFYELPSLFGKRKMKVGLYKISVFFKNDNKQIESHFFYFFQTSIWIDFVMDKTNPLLISCYYSSIPL